MRMRWLIKAAVIAPILMAGCGSGAGRHHELSPAQQIRATNVAFLEYAAKGDFDRACAMTTDPGACIGTFLQYQDAAGGTSSFGAYVPDVKAAPVTVTGGNATLTVRGEAEAMRLVDGRWLIVQ
jgi:outer membrane murein-binding lipoprotein Lpp